MNTLPHRRASAGVILSIVTLLAACNGGSSARTPGAPGAGRPSPTGPETPVGNQPAPGGPGNVADGGQLTVAKPGQLDVHPVAAELLEAEVAGRHVTIRITWTSGVEPCSVLDTILVDRGEKAFAITLREGHAPGNQICIEIAMQKHALVDLGDLEPGTYTITDSTAGAAPIQIVVS